MTSPRSSNVQWHGGKLTREERAALLKSRGATLWFTGLPSSGKSTIASALELSLVRSGAHCYRLDGDNVRLGLNRDLGFSAEDRHENIRRIAEVAKLFADSCAVALTSFICPYASDRAWARELHDRAGLPFLEIYVDTPVEECERRDPKGLYKRARAGELKDFTGIDAPYEAPVAPDLRLRASELSVDECVSACLRLLESRVGVVRW